ENPAFNFFTAKDVQLQGTINVGAAGFKFGEDNNITFACQNLAMSDVPCTFEMSMTEAGQQMVVTLTSNDAKITGTYAVNMSGVVTFTVTAVDDALATYISVGTVFSNAN
nr:hypothetical protein [Bacilli bacterium]